MEVMYSIGKGVYHGTIKSAHNFIGKTTLKLQNCLSYPL